MSTLQSGQVEIIHQILANTLISDYFRSLYISLQLVCEGSDRWILFSRRNLTIDNDPR